MKRIKNLKISKIDGKKKYDYKKINNFVFALLLTGTLTSCNDYKEIEYINNSNDHNYFNEINSPENHEQNDIYENFTINNNKYYEQQNEDNDDIINIPSNSDKYLIDDKNTNDVNNLEQNNINYEKIYNNVINGTISINSNSINYFKSYLNSIVVEYPYQQLYGIDVALKKYNEYNKDTIFNNTIIKNNSLSVDDLYSKVIENNKTLIESRQMSNGKVRDVCEIICGIINDYLKNNKDVDYGLLSEKLVNLRIEQYSSFGNGYYNSETNTMGINSTTSDGKKIEETIKHETYHLIQNGANMVNRNANVETQFGFCYKFKNEPINPLNLTWYYEGSAEYLTMNYNDSMDATVYNSVIQDMKTIKVATVLNNNTGINDFENISLSNDLNKLFKYFNCHTEEDKREILNMMFAYELVDDLNVASSSKDFYKLYAKNLDIIDFKKDLKESIAMTLTKQFYSNLIDYKGNEINDIFSLISIFENEISRQIWYVSNKNNLQDFFSVYNDIQGNYFQILASEYNLDVQTIVNLYNMFNEKTIVDSNSINNISKEKQDFYKHIIETRKSDKKDSINVVSKSK